MQTLKEQFKEAIDKCLFTEVIDNRINCIKKCESIADMQAIEFAKWTSYFYWTFKLNLRTGLVDWTNGKKRCSSEQLLQQFK